MGENLKPCPFCGGQPWIDHIEPHSHLLSFMPDYKGSYCVECKCGVGLIAEDRKKVCDAWNRRANE